MAHNSGGNHHLRTMATMAAIIAQQQSQQRQPRQSPYNDDDNRAQRCKLAMEAGGHTGQSRNGDDNSGTVVRHYYSSNVLCRTTYEYITCCYYFVGKLAKGQSFSRCQGSIRAAGKLNQKGQKRGRARSWKEKGL